MLPNLPTRPVLPPDLPRQRRIQNEQLDHPIVIVSSAWKGFLSPVDRWIIPTIGRVHAGPSALRPKTSSDRKQEDPSRSMVGAPKNLRPLSRRPISSRSTNDRCYNAM